MGELTKTILEIEALQKLQPDSSVIKILPRETCENIQAILFGKEKNTLKVLTTNNFPEQIQKLLKTLEDKGYRSELFYTSSEGFGFALGRYDQIIKQEQRLIDEQRAEKQARGKGAIAVIQKLFEKRDTMDPGEFILQIVRLAFQTGASDLHFQSEEKGVLTRIRIDGVLQEILEFTHDDFRKYLQKLKFISGAKMNIDYLPEDGRFDFVVEKDNESKKVDARLSFLPGITEESTVIRFLDSSAGLKTFEELGFKGKSYDLLDKHLEKNTGIIIFSGPTGCGKTTTLYSILNYLNNGKEKIITLEDPIEYEIPGIQQSQINYTKGYTYEVGLKSVLRHDPDIILVGETRTLETAEISINAALTGHLVFTTLHTNTAIEAITRLINMGIKPYMLAPSLNLVVSQRLVRKVCPYCATKKDPDYAESAEITEAIKRINDMDPTMKLDFHRQIPQIVGCDHCNGTGYIGRVAIVEVFDVSEDIKKMIVEGKDAITIYAEARENGFLTMKEDGIIKMLEGLTTLDELRRVL
ncbi:MAG: GspE/PulE family protein [Candidatus Absconditabacterales bacterium]